MLLVLVFFFLILACWIKNGACSTVTTLSAIRTSTLPGDFSVTDEVEFYYLQGVAPYNLNTQDYNYFKQNVLKGGSMTHAGIGVWDRTTNAKFSLELVSSTGNYGKCVGCGRGCTHEGGGETLFSTRATMFKLFMSNSAYSFCLFES
jgi:hypothetical protein